jgi:hypothetical protein
MIPRNRLGVVGVALSCALCAPALAQRDGKTVQEPWGIYRECAARLVGAIVESAKKAHR